MYVAAAVLTSQFRNVNMIQGWGLPQVDDGSGELENEMLVRAYCFTDEQTHKKDVNIATTVRFFAVLIM